MPVAHSFATALDPAQTLVVRQPITHAQRAVVAYALSAPFPADAQGELGATTDVPSGAAPAEGFAHSSLQSLATAWPAGFPSGTGVLVQEFLPGAQAQEVLALDASPLTPTQADTLARLARQHPPAKLLAMGVDSQEQFSSMTACGATLFMGDWASHPKVIRNKAMAPGQASVLQLINLVRKQASMNEIEAVLKTDAMLGFKLMRLINSSGFGRTHEVASFRHAVMLLGLDRLFRWTAMLLTVSGNTGAPPVVGTTAVVRGRMMELLAATAGTAEEADNAFTVGLFSLLDDMLGLPMEQALVLLPLPPSINEALRYGTGPYGPWLRLCKACEAKDDSALREAATALQLTPLQINTVHRDALVWAAALEV